MLGRKIPIYYLALSTALGGSITYLLIENKSNRDALEASEPTSASNNNNSISGCNDGAIRLKGYKYVDPLLYEERECESKWLSPLKQILVNYIDNEKRSGLVTSVSVYIKVFSNDDWTAISPDETYHPASLLKLPVLFTFARMAETNPDLLDEKVFFEKHDPNLPKQIFVSKQLQPGKSYTIRELLRYLIAYSDNDALMLLYNYHNPEVYKKVFTDLGMSLPELNRDDANITVNKYSALMKVLYNGTYLSPSSSEFALSYLAESDFKDGLLKGLPADLKVAHKFGEYYNTTSSELHESAIVYTDKGDYLITVMSRGRSMKELSNVLGRISNRVYNFIVQGGNTSSAANNNANAN
jgi:beta-lactamase class A